MPRCEHGIDPVTGLSGLEKAKNVKLRAIDADTSEAILAGFDYVVDGTRYMFSYDSFDQQNFADSASVAILALNGTPGLPQTVTWNAYTIPEKNLIRLHFSLQTFLDLYTGGALVHKATQMERGGLRKASVQAATTMETVQSA